MNGKHPVEVPGRLTAKSQIIEQCASRWSYLLRQGLVSFDFLSLSGGLGSSFVAHFSFLYIAFLKRAILDCIAQGSVVRAPTVSWDL